MKRPGISTASFKAAIYPQLYDIQVLYATCVSVMCIDGVIKAMAVSYEIVLL